MPFEQPMHVVQFAKFTTPAKKIWEAIPEHRREAQLSSVWCGRCTASTTIVGYQGAVKSGELILTGRCKACGSGVAHVVAAG